MESFVKLTELAKETDSVVETVKTDEIDTELDKITSYNNIYQFQGIENESKAKFSLIGKLYEVNDVLITEFDHKDYTYSFVSKIYGDTIKEIEESGFFQLVKVYIKSIKTNKIVAYCSYNFHTKEHIKLNKSIVDLTNVEIDGYFDITLHFDNRYFILHKLDKCDNPNKILYRLTELVLSQDVLDCII
jgi:hypothetical protein